MIYLCSTYSVGNASKALREERYHLAMAFVASRIDEAIFSPIVHSHPMGLIYDLPPEYDFWKKIDRKFIDHCEKVYVLMLEGWLRSKGIADETDYAKSIGKEVIYFNADGTRFSV
jgi:hypothetical protein